MFVIAYLLATNVYCKSRKRYFLYISWGFTAGIALWVHILVLPFVVCSGLLILIFCYRDWRSAAIPCLLLGLFIGGFLLIPGYQAIPDALGTQGGGIALQAALPAERIDLLQKQFVSTILWGIPLTTWVQPICLYQELPFFGPPTSSTISCSLTQGIWSVGYLFLLIGGLSITGYTCWKLWRHTQYPAIYAAERSAMVKHVARFLLLFTGFIAIVLYLHSPLSGLRPVSTRYLVGLLVVTPGILWPIWRLTGLEKRSITRKSPTVLLSRAILLLVVLVALVGTTYTFTTVPAAYADAQQQQKLVRDLLHMHVTRVYLEYWSCYRLLFESQERILCAQPPYPSIVGGDRYTADARAVQPDPHVINPHIPLLFPANSKGEIAEFELYNKNHHKHFKKYTLDNMELYIPSQ